jgi:hypothetical protein
MPSPIELLLFSMLNCYLWYFAQYVAKLGWLVPYTSNQFATYCCHCCCGGVVLVVVYNVYPNEQSYSKVHLERDGGRMPCFFYEYCVDTGANLSHSM